MALSDSYEIKGNRGQLNNPQVVNAAVLYAGAYAALGARDHGTTATRGRTKGFVLENGMIPLGRHRSKNTTGNTSASPIPRGDIGLGGGVEDVAVGGLAGTVADVGRLVFMTDDNTFTISTPSVTLLARVVGIIADFINSSRANVQFFAFETMLAADAGLGWFHEWNLGVISGNFSSGGNGKTGITAPCKGRLLAVYGHVVEALTGGGSQDLDINLEIGGTNVTGGVIEWVAGDAIGDRKAGTAITDDGANVFHKGSQIDVEVAVNTAGTGGLMEIRALFMAEPGT